VPSCLSHPIVHYRVPTTTVGCPAHSLQLATLRGGKEIRLLCANRPVVNSVVLVLPCRPIPTRYLKSPDSSSFIYPLPGWPAVTTQCAPFNKEPDGAPCSRREISSPGTQLGSCRNPCYRLRPRSQKGIVTIFLRRRGRDSGLVFLTLTLLPFFLFPCIL
jgi:hypothetical protein